MITCVVSEDERAGMDFLSHSLKREGGRERRCWVDCQHSNIFAGAIRSTVI